MVIQSSESSILSTDLKKKVFYCIVQEMQGFDLYEALLLVNFLKTLATPVVFNCIQFRERA